MKKKSPFIHKLPSPKLMHEGMPLPLLPPTNDKINK
jgi:hypothetical protein